MAGRLDTVFRTWDRAGRGWLDTTQFNMICADLGIEQVSFTLARELSIQLLFPWRQASFALLSLFYFSLN